MSTNANESAYPITLDSPEQEFSPGLSKREYFAAMALQGYLASYAGGHSDPSVEAVALKSVMYADALIAALNNSKQSL